MKSGLHALALLIAVGLLAGCPDNPSEKKKADNRKNANPPLRTGDQVMTTSSQHVGTINAPANAVPTVIFRDGSSVNATETQTVRMPKK